MKVLFTQKTYYLVWIGGLLCLLFGIWYPETMVSYQFFDRLLEVKLVELVGGVASFLFLIGLGYYAVIKAKGSVPLWLTLFQLLLTLVFCYWILFPDAVKGYYESLDIEMSSFAPHSQDVLFLFFLTMLIYSIDLGWALLKKRKDPLF